MQYHLFLLRPLTKLALIKLVFMIVHGRDFSVLFNKKIWLTLNFNNKQMIKLNRMKKKEMKGLMVLKKELKQMMLRDSTTKNNFVFEDESQIF